MPEIGTSGLMSGDGKRGGTFASVPAPILDSTGWPIANRPQAASLPHTVQVRLASADDWYSDRPGGLSHC